MLRFVLLSLCNAHDACHELISQSSGTLRVLVAVVAAVAHACSCVHAVVCITCLSMVCIYVLFNHCLLLLQREFITMMLSKALAQHQYDLLHKAAVVKLLVLSVMHDQCDK
jgi:hypothetical protein